MEGLKCYCLGNDGIEVLSIRGVAGRKGVEKEKAIRERHVLGGKKSLGGRRWMNFDIGSYLSAFARVPLGLIPARHICQRRMAFIALYRVN